MLTFFLHTLLFFFYSFVSIYGAIETQKTDIVLFTEAIKTNNERDIVHLIQTNKNYIYEHNDSFLKFIEISHSKSVRTFFIELITDISSIDTKNEYYLQAQKITNTVIRKELNLLKNKKHLSKEDENILISCLEIIKENNLKSFFYDIVPYIGYHFANIRQLTAKTLSNLKDDHLFPVLMNLMTSSSSIEKIYALEAFEYIHDKRILPTLLDSLKDNNKSIRYYALRALENFESLEANNLIIKLAASDNNLEVKIKATEYLGKRKNINAFYTIAKNISDTNYNLRKISIEYLINYRDTRAALYISNQLALETNNILKLSLIKGLLILNNTGSMNGINKILSKEKDIEILKWAIYTVAEIKDNRAVVSIIPLMKHSDETIRIEAASALGEFSDLQSYSILLENLINTEEKYSIQTASLFAIATIKKDSLIRDLFELSETHSNIFLCNQVKEIIKILLNRKNL